MRDKDKDLKAVESEVTESPTEKEENITESEVTESPTEKEEIPESPNDEVKESDEVEQPTAKDGDTVVVCNCSKLNIRKKPSLEAEVLEIVSVGSTLKINGEPRNGWARVYTDSDVKGFVMAEYITPQEM